MAGKLLNIKVCIPSKLHHGFTAMCRTICHYSYNLSLYNIKVIKMRRFFYTITITLFLSTGVFGQKPKVVILGVEHSSQLINSNHQPAVLRAFINKVNPSVICIERSPEEFSRNDFYEFTYEQQNVIIPYARQQKIPIYPIDWLPGPEDLKLAFGTDNLEVPSFTRNPSGFWGFTVFPDSTSFHKDFYFADDIKYPLSHKEWYATHPDKVNFDFARRLFLYRSFLQSKRIQLVLNNFSENDTVLVVIGAMHKYDIEKNLEGNGFTLIKPKSYGTINTTEIDDNFDKKDAYAILNFNLLGMQYNLSKPNLELVEYAFDKIRNDTNSEKELYAIKFDLLNNNINSKSAIKRYKKLLDNPQSKNNFVWTGVKYKDRIDSYFDPFGNMTLNQRIRLELAREYLNISEDNLFEKTRDTLVNEFNGLKKNLLISYLETYLEK